jgi:hypothetical protein
LASGIRFPGGDVDSFARIHPRQIVLGADSRRFYRCASLGTPLFVQAPLFFTRDWTAIDDYRDLAEEGIDRDYYQRGCGVVLGGDANSERNSSATEWLSLIEVMFDRSDEQALRSAPSFRKARGQRACSRDRRYIAGSGRSQAAAAARQARRRDYPARQAANSFESSAGKIVGSPWPAFSLHYAHFPLAPISLAQIVPDWSERC